MSKNIKTLGLVSIMILAAACARQTQEEEFVVVEPEPISVEPVHTGKFK